MSADASQDLSAACEVVKANDVVANELVAGAIVADVELKDPAPIAAVAPRVQFDDHLQHHATPLPNPNSDKAGQRGPSDIVLSLLARALSPREFGKPHAAARATFEAGCCSAVGRQPLGQVHHEDAQVSRPATPASKGLLLGSEAGRVAQFRCSNCRRTAAA